MMFCGWGGSHGMLYELITGGRWLWQHLSGRPSQQPIPWPMGSVCPMFWPLTWLGTGLATITYFPWSIPVISQGLQTFFGRFFALNLAVVVTFWMVQQSEHHITIRFPIVGSMWRSHCWGRSLFTIITSCPNNGSVSHAHASNNSKSYCSYCWTVQNVATMCSC